MARDPVSSSATEGSAPQAETRVDTNEGLVLAVVDGELRLEHAVLEGSVVRYEATDRVAVADVLAIGSDKPEFSLWGAGVIALALLGAGLLLVRFVGFGGGLVLASAVVFIAAIVRRLRRPTNVEIVLRGQFAGTPDRVVYEITPLAFRRLRAALDEARAREGLPPVPDAARFNAGG